MSEKAGLAETKSFGMVLWLGITTGRMARHLHQGYGRNVLYHNNGDGPLPTSAKNRRLGLRDGSRRGVV